VYCRAVERTFFTRRFGAGQGHFYEQALPVRRTRQRLPSNGFIESAPEHLALMLFFCQCALLIKH
jgi:hypothetical protein